MTTPIIFFLFETVKNKNKKKPKSKSPKKKEHFALSFISSNDKSSKINTLYEKLQKW